MGIMERSTPTVNRPMPRISISAPKVNMSIVPAFKGEMVTLSSSTIPVIGSTEARDSLIFSSNGPTHLCLIIQPLNPVLGR